MFHSPSSSQLISIINAMLYALLHLDMKYQRNPRQLMNVGQRSSLIRPRY